MTYQPKSTYTNTSITVNGLWYANLDTNLIDITSGSGYTININPGCCGLGGGGSGGRSVGNSTSIGLNGKHGIYNSVTIANIYNYGCLAGGGGGGGGGSAEGLIGGNGGNGGGGGGGCGSTGTAGNGGGASENSYISLGYSGGNIGGGGGGGYGTDKIKDNNGGGGAGPLSPSSGSSGGDGSNAPTTNVPTINNDTIIQGGQGGGISGAAGGLPGVNGGGGGGGGTAGGGGAGGGRGFYGFNDLSGGGGSGGGDSVGSGGKGGYGIYNTNTIVNLYNAQGISTTTSDGISYGPLIYGGLPGGVIENYYIKINTSSDYGQLFNRGFSAIPGIKVNFNIDPASDLTTDGIYYNVLYGITPNSDKGTTTLTNGKKCTWTLTETATSSGIYNLAVTIVAIIIVNPVGFKVLSTKNYPALTDLSSIFQGLNGTTTLNKTGFVSNNGNFTNKDLSEIYQPLSSSSTQALATGYTTTKNSYAGKDLSAIFEPL
jgi:hypothetical protein